MNIFILHHDPIWCAQMHCDKHVLKMIIEYAQLMSTANRALEREVTYKSTHKNHPSAVWVRNSKLHYEWLYELWQELMSEYTWRYRKTHSCSRLSHELHPSLYSGEAADWVDPPKCMPDQYKIRCTIESYRNFYRGDKSRFASWKRRAIPIFMSEPCKTS